DGEDLAPDRNDTSRRKAVHRVLEDFAKKHDRVHVPDTYSYLCPNGSYEKRIDGVWMRDDGVHYSAEGAHESWSWLMPQVNETVKREGGRCCPCPPQPEDPREGPDAPAHLDADPGGAQRPPRRAQRASGPR